MCQVSIILKISLLWRGETWKAGTWSIPQSLLLGVNLPLKIFICGCETWISKTAGVEACELHSIGWMLSIFRKQEGRDRWEKRVLGQAKIGQYFYFGVWTRNSSLQISCKHQKESYKEWERWTTIREDRRVKQSYQRKGLATNWPSNVFGHIKQKTSKQNKTKTSSWWNHKSALGRLWSQ